MADEDNHCMGHWQLCLCQMNTITVNKHIPPILPVIGNAK